MPHNSPYFIADIVNPRTILLLQLQVVNKNQNQNCLPVIRPNTGAWSLVLKYSFNILKVG